MSSQDKRGAPSLSEEDFQRIQNSLIELKNKNYALEEQCRKQKSALGETSARCSVLEQELGKAQRAIAKSKKATEVQLLMQDNDLLKKKLHSQEEEFRVQNQTLLTELSNLVTINEKMEAEIKSLSTSDVSSASSASSSLPDRPLTAEITSLREENVTLLSRMNSDRESAQRELTGLKKTLRRATEDNEALKGQLEKAQAAAALAGRRSPETVDVMGGGVSFKRQQSESGGDGTEANADILDSQQQQKLRGENERLSAQLQSGFDGFNSFKQKKAEEVQQLNEKIEAMTRKMEVYSPERFSSIENGLESCRAQLSSATSEISELRQKCAECDLEKCRLEKELEETNMTSERRKANLDEMAITMQSNADENANTIALLEKQLSGMKSEAESTADRLQEARDEAERCKKSETESRRALGGAKAEAQELKASLEGVQRGLEERLQREGESHRDEMSILKQESEMVARDLRTQLEISNAQRAEFEESIAHLDQEMRDRQEDLKIGEKKNSALLKDLKRQLRQEKQINEKLQEKIKVYGFSGGEANSEPRSEIEADRSSISSWSMMSGNNDGAHSRSTPIPVPSNATSSSAASPAAASGGIEPLPRDGSPRAQNPSSSPAPTTATMMSSDDQVLLLDKINSLQEGRLTLEERVHMLEHSAAAMADELLKKSAIIQYYCMEERHKKTAIGSRGNNGSVPSTPTSDKVKKIVDLFVHPDSETRREVQRMQNMLEEALTKNMHLTGDLESMSQEVVRLSKLAATGNDE